MGKLVCRIELDKEKGIILTVENDDQKITQTIVMDGTNITTTVKGSDQTSTITQKKDSIQIDCKEFTLNAETIKCVSKKETIHESGLDFTVNSKKGLNVSATADAKYKAMNAEFKSDLETKVNGTTVKLNGTASLEIKSPCTSIQSSGMLEMKSNGVVNIEAPIVNIKNFLNLG